MSHIQQHGDFCFRTPRRNVGSSLGFTLIELLVVIAIIALIASIVLLSVTKTRIMARDAQRIANAEQLRTALEMYGTDTGSYRFSGAGLAATSTAGGFVAKNNVDDVTYSTKSILASLQEKGLMSRANLLDPIYDKNNYYLGACADPSAYAIFLKVEDKTKAMSTSTLSGYCGGDTAPSLGFNYALNGANVPASGLAGSLGGGSIAGVGWSLQTTPPGTNSLYNPLVTYGAGRYVATTGYKSLTSTDGINWSTLNIPSLANPAFNFVNGKFIMISRWDGVGGTYGSRDIPAVMTSSDGINWSTFNMKNYYSWSSIAYGNGKYVSVACGNANSDGVHTVMTSVDGDTWTIGTSPSSDCWQKVIYASSTFVAISNGGGTNGKRVMTSTDGVTWTLRNTPNYAFTGLTYGAGLFVAVANTGSVSAIATSPDGVTWTSQNTPTAQGWQAVTFGAGKFLAAAVGGVAGNLMSSSDGVTWTAVTASSTEGWRDVQYLGGKFIATKSMYSSPLLAGDTFMVGSSTTSWVMANSNILDPAWSSLAYGNGIFVATTYDNDGSIMTSPDGSSWTKRVAVPGEYVEEVAFGNGRFVAISPDDTYQVLTSTDGINWSGVPTSDAPMYGYDAVEFVNDRFIAASWNGNNNGQLITSTDGLHWTQLSFNDGWYSYDPHSIAYGNGRYVVLNGGQGIVSTANNPIATSWTTASNSMSGNVVLTFGNNLFVAAETKTNGHSWVSSDGSNWTDGGVLPCSSVDQLTSGMGQFVAICDDAHALSSTDGSHWTVMNTPRAGYWEDLIYGNGRFVAVSSDGIQNNVITSP